MTEADIQIEGPTDGPDGERSYTARAGGHTVHFSVFPADENTWDVRIEGVPEPTIIHDQPWTSPEDAEQAALRVVCTMLDIEEMRDETEGLEEPTEEDDTCS